MEASNFLTSELSSEARLKQIVEMTWTRKNSPGNCRCKDKPALGSKALKKNCVRLTPPGGGQLTKGKNPICLKFNVGTVDLL
jgi:hypothetical protein